MHKAALSMGECRESLLYSADPPCLRLLTASQPEARVEVSVRGYCPRCEFWGPAAASGKVWSRQSRYRQRPAPGTLASVPRCSPRTRTCSNRLSSSSSPPCFLSQHCDERVMYFCSLCVSVDMAVKLKMVAAPVSSVISLCIFLFCEVWKTGCLGTRNTNSCF